MTRLFPVLLLLGCPSKSTIVDARTEDSASPPSTDACDEDPGEVICVDGTAITCSASGDVEAEEECGAGTVCIDDAGCTDCTVELTIPMSAADTSALVPVQAETTEVNFGWQRYHMRAVRISADPELTQGDITLTLEGDEFAMWGTEGALLGSSATISAADLPAEVLIAATGLGEATLSGTNADCAGDGSTVHLHSGDQPPLSGYPLSDFPYFERVKVFNSNEVIRTTLDPARHSDRVGQPYKVYIVDHKTPAEWAEDPSLIDISLGTAESTTVSGDGVAENIIDAWVEEIPINRGISRGMDVVFDFNDNLKLDPGDISMGPGQATPGLTAVGNLASSGPSTVTMFEHGSPPWNQQRVYYPEDIGDLGPVPLIVISHGNGHHYTWYDYLGYHLASWGYVVMSHTNHTGPGIETASTTTLTNTDSFLAALGALESGALNGQVDASRIVWIGHSRGGEGVVRAYDRIVDEGYIPSFYGPEDIILISSIAPTVFYSVEESDPHDRPYHLFAGAADGDVHGAPSSQYVQFFRILSAAEGASQMTYLQGVGHNEFNCCGFPDATGPDLIGREETQVVAKSYYLALIRAYADQDAAMLDYITRRADVFRPQEIADHVVIANTYRPDPATQIRVLDDFQAESTEERSAAGDTVILDVEGVYEGALVDGDGLLTYTTHDPMNGMTQGGYAYDENRGLVFSWGVGIEGGVTWLVPDAMEDLSSYTWLSFRAAQITRHPYTMITSGSLHMTVELVDTSGKEQAIRHEEMGGLTSPYARGSSGTYGWSNEFNTIRLRISDFASGDSQVDLTQVAAVRLRVGESWGTSQGAIGIDDLVLEK